MKENNIQVHFVRKMRKSQKHRKNIEKTKINYPDLVNRNFKGIKEKFKVLFTDVTYLVWKGQRYYQSTVLDGFSKEIIDFKISKFNDNKLVIDNLISAINKIKEYKSDLKGIIIHSDHRYQYTSKFTTMNVYLMVL